MNRWCRLRGRLGRLKGKREKTNRNRWGIGRCYWRVGNREYNLCSWWRWSGRWNRGRCRGGIGWLLGRCIGRQNRQSLIHSSASYSHSNISYTPYCSYTPYIPASPPHTAYNSPHPRFSWALHTHNPHSPPQNSYHTSHSSPSKHNQHTQ